MAEPLRYTITDWHQLSNCESNNSRDLFIRVSDIIQTGVLTGLKIQVCHTAFGALFACVLNAQGSIITPTDQNEVIEFTTDRILQELAKYGFLVTYNQVAYLPTDQLSFLYSLLALGYDKLRVINVRKSKTEAYKYLVVFDVDKAPLWLNNLHVASYNEYTSVLQRGGAVNITDKGKRWHWEWLDFIANIEDILEQNDYSG